VLYGSILLMPITGWLHHASLEGFAPIWWPFAQDLPFIPKDPELARFLGAAHEFTAFLLISSLVLHIAGAMKHALIDRDQTLSRMLPWNKVEISKSLSESKNKASSRLFAGGIFVALLLALIASQMSFQKTSSQSDAITRSASTSGWSVDYTKSSLNIEIIQNNNPVQGSFSEWQADVIFDPDALDQASVEVRIKTASLILGGVTKDAISGNFLNVLEFPQAVFSSDKFFKVSDGKFQAVGDLTIAGITKPLILPFDLKIENGRAFMQSNVELQRLDYELGRQGYTTDGILGFAVKVNVMLEANKT
jgi:polyisoprenoid-binding protein YceI